MQRNRDRNVTTGTSGEVGHEPSSVEAAQRARAMEQKPSATTAAPGDLPGKLAGLPLWRQALVLAIWPLFELLLKSVVDLVDLAIAGRIGTEDITLAATDALGTAGYFGWLTGIFLQTVGIGATALTARAVGARHKTLASAVIGQSITLGVTIGAIFGLVLFIAAPWVVTIVGLEKQAGEFFVLYVRMLAVTTPAMGILLIGNGCMRGAGDTRTPFEIMVVVNVVNMIASLLLVFGPAPIGGHGIAGIAGGTMLAWLVGAALVIFALRSGKPGVRLFFHRLPVKIHTTQRILRIGLPSLVEMLVGIWLANFVILTLVGRISGQGTIGAHMIGIRIESLSFLPGMAIGTATATLAGQYLGAKNPERAKAAVRICAAYAACTMGLIGVIFMSVPEAMVRLITNAPSLIETAAPLVRLCGAIQIPFALYIVISKSLQGVGATRLTMAITTSTTFLFRLPMAFFLGWYMEMGLYGIWIGLCSELALRGLCFSIAYFKANWVETQV